MPTAYLTNTEELTMVADAIREKGELSQQFTYPNGFISAIRTLTTGTEIVATDMLNNLISGTCYFPTATYIGSYAFASCSKLTGVYLPQVSVVYNSGFYYCSSVSFISLPICTTVSSYAFYNCTSLTSVYLPECREIGSNAFYYCTKLTSIDLPNINSIGESAFLYCYSLSYISVSNCSYLGFGAFYYCSRMLFADIRGITMSSLSAYLFCGCYSLEYVYLQGTASGCAYSTFYNCNNLKSVYLDFPYVLRTNSPLVDKSVPHPTIPNSTTTVGRYDVDVYVPFSLLNSYMASSRWASYNLLPIY